MAVYLSSMNPAAGGTDASAVIAASDAATRQAAIAEPVGARIFEGACASCHAGDKAIPHLALNSNLHAVRPNNVVEAIRSGVPAPVGQPEDAMAMPGFGKTLDDQAMADLVRYLRARFAPNAEPWTDTRREPGVSHHRPVGGAAR